jgi:5-hydroxyisourate hydrolase-like protein (transthyretin family)
MKRLQIVFPLALFALVALLVYLERPTAPSTEGFDFDTARPDPLPPLAMPRGELELAGIVERSDGGPAADVLVTLLAGDADASAEPLFWTYSGADGAFALADLSPGAYRVLLVHPSVPPTSVEVTLPVGAPVRWTLSAPLPSLPYLPELVRRELQGALQRPSTLEPRGFTGYEVVLRPTAENELLSGAAVRRIASDEGGRFVVADLAVAAYAIEVVPPWARGGSWPVLGRGTLARDADPAEELRLSLAVGEVEGEVLEATGRPLEGVLVKLSSLEAVDQLGAPQTWPTAVTDAAGRFRYADLPAGRYRLELRAGLEARQVEVEVRVGEVTSVPAVAIDPRAGGARGAAAPGEGSGG